MVFSEQSNHHMNPLLIPHLSSHCRLVFRLRTGIRVRFHFQLQFGFVGRQTNGIYIPSTLESVQLVMHHPTIFESYASLRHQWRTRPLKIKGVGRVQERLKGISISSSSVQRIFSGRIRSWWDGVRGSRERTVRIYLMSVAPGSVVNLCRLVLVQKMSVHRGVINGGVDVGLIVCSRFWEGGVTRKESFPSGQIDGGPVGCRFVFPSKREENSLNMYLFLKVNNEG